VREQLALLPGYLTGHLQLALVSLLLGAALSIPTGIWITRRKRLEAGVLALAGVIQTVPSLALLAVMVPLLAWVGTFTVRAFGFPVPSIGFLPALIGLTLYSILPILQNTVAGISGVDPSLIEAARGVGMTRRQQLWRVELPLALPILVAGIRTSTVWVVGIATLSTPVGAPSLGNYIFSGLQTRNFKAVVVGCVAAAALALFLDGLVRVMEAGIRTRRRSLIGGAAGLLAALVAYAGITLGAERFGGREHAVRIGTKTFTEQYILGEILARQIARETSEEARAVPSLGSTVAFDALRTGALDVYVDYSGTIWATVMKRRDVPPDPRTVLGAVRLYLEREHGIVLVGALGFENAYALAMREARAGELGIRTISDLARHAPSLGVAGDYEFFSRTEWMSLQSVYGLRFRNQRSMDPSLMYEAVAGSQVDVISAFSTDGRIAAFGLKVLEDDRRAIPPYDAIILASRRLAREQPEVVAALRRLSGAISDSQMRRMNSAVDQDGRSPAAVAREFLENWAGEPRSLLRMRPLDPVARPGTRSEGAVERPVVVEEGERRVRTRGVEPVPHLRRRVLANKAGTRGLGALEPGGYEIGAVPVEQLRDPKVPLLHPDIIG